MRPTIQMVIFCLKNSIYNYHIHFQHKSQNLGGWGGQVDNTNIQVVSKLINLEPLLVKSHASQRAQMILWSHRSQGENKTVNRVKGRKMSWIQGFRGRWIALNKSNASYQGQKPDWKNLPVSFFISS